MKLFLAAAKVATTSTTVAASTAKPVSATSLLFQLLIGLMVVLAVIWVAARIARGRVGGITGAAKRRNTPLAVVSRQPIGKGVQIAVVKAGAEMYLLGITSHTVTRLARYQPDPSEVAESSDDLPAGGPPGPSGAPVAFRLQSSIRSLQERTLRRDQFPR